MNATNLQTREQIQQWLIDRFSQLTGVEASEVDVTRPFVDYLLDSTVAVTVSLELAKFLGHELPVTLFWEFPNISGLATALDQTQ